MNLNQANPSPNITLKNSPHVPNNANFQIPPMQVTWNINLQGHTPHVDHSN